MAEEAGMVPLQLDSRRAHPAQYSEHVTVILLIELVMRNLPLRVTKESLSPEQLFLSPVTMHLVHTEMLLWPEDVHDTLIQQEMHLSLADKQIYTTHSMMLIQEMFLMKMAILSMADPLFQDVVLLARSYLSSNLTLTLIHQQ